MAYQADTQEVIYGNRESNMPESTAIPIKKLEAYIRKKKREEVPYKTEFKVILQNILCAPVVSLSLLKPTVLFTFLDIVFQAIPDGELLDSKVGGKAENKKKNRFRNILACEYKCTL